MRQPVDLRISVCVDLYKLEGDVCLCESAADTLFSPLQQFAGSAGTFGSVSVSLAAVQY